MYKVAIFDKKLKKRIIKRFFSKKEIKKYLKKNKNNILLSICENNNFVLK